MEGKIRIEKWSWSSISLPPEHLTYREGTNPELETDKMVSTSRPSPDILLADSYYIEWGTYLFVQHYRDHCIYANIELASTSHLTRSLGRKERFSKLDPICNSPLYFSCNRIFFVYEQPFTVDACAPGTCTSEFDPECIFWPTVQGEAPDRLEGKKIRRDEAASGSACKTVWEAEERNDLGKSFGVLRKSKWTLF